MSELESVIVKIKTENIDDLTQLNGNHHYGCGEDESMVYSQPERDEYYLTPKIEPEDSNNETSPCPNTQQNSRKKGNSSSEIFIQMFNFSLFFRKTKRSKNWPK